MAAMKKIMHAIRTALLLLKKIMCLTHMHIGCHPYSFAAIKKILCLTHTDIGCTILNVCTYGIRTALLLQKKEFWISQKTLDVQV